MALGTTVLGIIVAAPALMADKYLKNVLRGYTVRMEGFASEVLSAVEMRYRIADVKVGI